MGLAQKKSRSKLSRDPNNTNWSQSTTRFGHKVLVSQGWTPGSTLGVPDSQYAGAHYTAASSSHVRVTVKNDTRGLGARTGRPDRDETFGLELLSGLLGRLNGKEEAVLQKEEAARRDVKLLTYHENRWGASRFVFGGYLVGDDIQDALDADQEKHTNKKCKRSRAETEQPNSADEMDPNDVPEKLAAKLARKENKRRKEEKRAGKVAKRLKRHQTTEDPVDTLSPSDQDIVQSAHDRSRSNVVSTATSETSTPVFTPRGRQAIRSRYIQQKRMAVLDEKALKEIFMIKKS